MRLKIIVTNDDGIDAPGLDALCRVAGRFGHTVVVAPREPQSGISHQVTNHRPIKVEPAGENRFAVHGTPADCTRVALKHLAPEADWLFAGINAGANLGADVYNSGTAAAAREAAILGCRAIAFSQYIGPGEAIDWEAAVFQLAPVIRMLLARGLAPGRFWNLNLPSPLDREKAVPHAFCPLDVNPHRYTFIPSENGLLYSGSIHERPRDPGHDVAVCFGGRIAVTQLAVGTPPAI